MDKMFTHNMNSSNIFKLFYVYLYLLYITFGVWILAQNLLHFTLSLLTYSIILSQFLIF